MVLLFIKSAGSELVVSIARLAMKKIYPLSALLKKTVIFQKEWREDRHGEFKRKVARCVRKSQETAFD